MNKVREGIEFILSHFEGRQQLFPRKMATAFSNNCQFAVYTFDQILNECIKANFIDCRINAYPVLADSTIPIQAPNIIFIDLDLRKDLRYEESIKQLDRSKNKSIKTVKEKLEGCIPSVLWTGNGYHIYIILETRPLEIIKELKDLSPKPSEEFLKFAEMTFSDKKKDSGHNPTFRSSLLRIPYTFNSKNINVDKEKAEVKIIQEFDKDDVKAINTEILRSFRLWLADNDLKSKQEKLKNTRYRNRPLVSKDNEQSNYSWIENLLQTPIPCFRRYCLYHILAPYLVNVRKLDYNECFDILYEWLNECNNISPISFDMETEIISRLKAVKNYKPISIQKLRKENVELYNMIILNEK